jgi:hypothetical protein
MFMQVSPMGMGLTTISSRLTVALTLQSTAPRYRRSPKNNIPSLVISPELCIKLVGSIALQNLLDKLNELEVSDDESDLIDAILYRGIVLETVEQLFTPAEA